MIACQCKRCRRSRNQLTAWERVAATAGDAIDWILFGTAFAGLLAFAIAVIAHSIGR